MSSRIFYLPILAFMLVQIASSSDISLKEGLSFSQNLTDAPRPLVEPSGINKSTPQKPLLATVLTAPQTTTVSEIISDSKSIHETWKTFEKTMKKILDGQMKKALPVFVKMGSEANISAECSKSLMALLLGVKGLKSWAFRMLDSSAKMIPSGILDGTLTDFGDFDECIAIEKLDSRKRVEFTGQYCVVETKPLMPAPPHRVQFNTKVLDFSNFSKPDSVLSNVAMNANMFYIVALRLGLCIPSTCTVNDIKEIADIAFTDIPMKVKVNSCEVKEPFRVSALQVACMTFLGIFVFLAIVGTYIDVKKSSIFNANKISSGIVSDSFRSFSIEKNLKKLLKISHSKENFGVLNGLRVLTFAWIVLLHTYAMSHKQGYARLVNVLDALDEITFGTVINAFISVDTFFVIGGFLVAYSNLKSLNKEDGRLNFTRYYSHRIWRLTPPLVGLLLVVFLMPLLGSGPLFQEIIGQQVQNCEKYWWQVLIIPINTWTNADDMCLGYTWYVSSDVHFYFLAPVVFIPLNKWPAVGFLIMVILTAACMGVIAALTIIHDLYPSVVIFSPNESFTKLVMNLTHLRPYTHVGAYCVGLALGFIVLRYRKADFKPVYQVLGWCAAVACNLAVLYGAFEWHRGNLPSQAISVSYAMLHRTAWAVGIAWLVYMCVTGRGGIINRFLSWDLFTPLARLSYSAYLIHGIVLGMRIGLRRRLLLFHHYDIFYEFLATFILSLCLSVTFHLLFEAPFLNLEEVWFPKNGRKLKVSSEGEVTTVTVTKIEN